MKQNKMILKYKHPAPMVGEFDRYADAAIYDAKASDEGKRYKKANSWERYSLPLGNGYFGANVFGRTETERIQISEPSLANPYYRAKDETKRHSSGSCGVNNFAEIMIDIGHGDVEDYEMALSLDDAVLDVKYSFGGTKYTRRIFTSHPDNVLVMHFSADKRASVTLDIKPFIPFLGDYTIEEGDGFGKSGTVEASGDTIILKGMMEYFGLKYEGRLKVLPDGGSLITGDESIKVEDADSCTILFTCSTGYTLTEDTFYSEDPKGKLDPDNDPSEAVKEAMRLASEKSFDELLCRHTEDYKSLYDRVKVNISEELPDEATDELLCQYRDGKRSSYLELLLFQYGRYLLISSSRTRLPANLQGIWNAYCDSPWSAGYWHNINIQMNYWLTGPADLCELFIPYIAYAKAYMKTARGYADAFIKTNYPEKLSPDGENGWIIGTGAGAYKIDGFMKVGHSGPGTGAFTSLLFWDYYDYTRDIDFLRDFGYPALREMSVFFSKILIERDGEYLIRESASPENAHGGVHYHTVGCAFDQQMVYENYKRTIEAAKILGIEDDDLITIIKKQLPHLSPVLLGDDGQLKEYREETTYGSIGDPLHRHVSHLVGLYPGTIINATTPEWLEGAKVTLTGRGDKSTGWATAHRLLLWARARVPHKSMDLVRSLISNNIMENLWDTHPPFQIDGNFGYTAGVCEMLLASHSGFIELLPSLPEEWATGEFSGLVARGNFSVDCAWAGGEVTKVSVRARTDGMMRIKLPKALCKDITLDQNGIFEKQMQAGEEISFG